MHNLGLGLHSLSVAEDVNVLFLPLVLTFWMIRAFVPTHFIAKQLMPLMMAMHEGKDVVQLY